MSALEKAEKLAELSAIGEKTLATEPATARIRELLADPDEDVRAEAAATAAHYPGDEALADALLERLGADEARSVRLRALEALGAIVEAGELAGAESDGYDPLPGDPSSAAYGRARAELLGALGEGRDAAERLAALEAVSVLSRNPEVVQAIEELAAEEGDAQAAALRCMARSADPRWADRIQAALEEGDGQLLGLAIEAAGRAEVTSAVPVLTRILRGGRQPVRERVRAARALGRLGGKATAPALLDVSESEADDEVRAAAHAALADLTLLDPAPAPTKEED